jgi:hypothetical protein
MGSRARAGGEVAMIAYPLPRPEKAWKAMNSGTTKEAAA